MSQSQNIRISELKQTSRFFIVNCDDLGSSHSANRAIYESLSKGFATSATLMVPCPWAFEAASRLKDFPIGVHLTLTAEYGGYRWRSLTHGASLHDEAGYLPRSTDAALARLDPEDARAECRAQIETALSWGLDVTHLDAHMMVMQFRQDLSEIYIDLASEYGLPVRMLGKGHPAIDFDPRAQADRRGVLYNDHLIEPWPRPTRDVLRESIPGLASGVTEVYVHPVAAGDELYAYDEGNAHIRVHDSECLLDRALIEMIDHHGIELVSYRILRELQRAGARGATGSSAALAGSGS